MTPSLFSEVLADLPLQEAISATAGLGYPAIELLCAAPHFDLERARRDANDVAGRIRDAGLAVSVLSLHNSFTEPARLAEQLDRVRTFTALAPAFGTRVLQLDPGRPAAPEAGPEQWQCLAQALPELSAMADGDGVKLAFHTTMRQITSTVAGAERLLDLAAAESIGVSADFCNLRINGDDPAHVIDRLGSRIYHTHIKNSDVGADGSWLFSRLDRGLLDYTDLLPRLYAAGYRGYLSIESIGQGARKYPAAEAVREAGTDLDLLHSYLRQAGIDR
jgi:sugar phosphate isomerase/epimerase